MGGHGREDEDGKGDVGEVGSRGLGSCREGVCVWKVALHGLGYCTCKSHTNVGQRNDGKSSCANTGDTYGRRGRTEGNPDSASAKLEHRARAFRDVRQRQLLVSSAQRRYHGWGAQAEGDHIRLGVLVKVKAIHGCHRRASTGPRRWRGPSLPCVRVAPWRCERLGLGRDRSFQRVYLHLFRGPRVDRRWIKVHTDIVKT